MRSGAISRFVRGDGGSGIGQIALGYFFQQREDSLEALAVRRGPQPSERQPRLNEHRFLVSKGEKPALAVIGPDSRCADAAKREIFVAEMQKRVVDGHAAGGGPVENLLARRRVTAEHV